MKHAKGCKPLWVAKVEKDADGYISIICHRPDSYLYDDGWDVELLIADPLKNILGCKKRLVRRVWRDIINDFSYVVIANIAFASLDWKKVGIKAMYVGRKK